MSGASNEDMRDRDLELIAALVEGRLDDEAEARALIDSSPEYREEYEAQKAAHHALRAMGSAALTESERAALHRDVWTNLQGVPGRARKTGGWYYRWVAVAGGALVMVGLVAVLGQGVGGQDSDETFAEIAADLDAGGATTTAAASESYSASGADRGESGDEAEESESQPETLAGAETTIAGDSAAPTDGESAAFYSGEAEKVRSGEFTTRLEFYESAGADPELEACVAGAGLESHRVVATLTPPPGVDEAEQRLAVVVPQDADIEFAPLTFVDLGRCQVVHVDE